MESGVSYITLPENSGEHGGHVELENKEYWVDYSYICHDWYMGNMPKQGGHVELENKEYWVDYSDIHLGIIYG